MRKKKPKISHAHMNMRLEKFIQSFVKDFGDEDVSMNKIDTATRIFVDSLTPLERGVLLYEGAVPIELSQLSADDYDYYTSKYGAENMKKGQFFRLPSGKTSFITHEHNLKYKVES
jgi:hypothetical protein